MSIGNNIKQLRLKYGLDQVQLGEIAGVTDKAVSSWENNISVPRMGAIEKIATYFGIKKSDIIEDAETPTSISHYGGQDNDITFDDFTFAMYEETKDLTDEQKEALLHMAKTLKKTLKKE